MVGTSKENDPCETHMFLGQLLSVQNDVIFIGALLAFILLAFYLHGLKQETIDNGFVTDGHVDAAQTMDWEAVQAIPFNTRKCLQHEFKREMALLYLAYHRNTCHMDQFL